MDDKAPPNEQDGIPPAAATVMTSAAELSIAAHVLQHLGMNVGSAMSPDSTDQEITEVCRSVLVICLKTFGPPPRKSSWLDDLGPTVGPMLVMLGSSLTNISMEPVGVGPVGPPEEPPKEEEEAGDPSEPVKPN